MSVLSTSTRSTPHFGGGAAADTADEASPHNRVQRDETSGRRRQETSKTVSRAWTFWLSALVSTKGVGASEPSSINRRLVAVATGCLKSTRFSGFVLRHESNVASPNQEAREGLAPKTEPEASHDQSRVRYGQTEGSAANARIIQPQVI